MTITFKNLKITAKMRTPIATIEPIILDSIISAAKAKDILKDNYYQTHNTHGDYELIRSTLDKILDRESGVYCTSVGLGTSREFVGSWSKRWTNKDTDLIKWKGRGKKRVDTGRGRYKNYHMPLIIKSIKEITFYARGEKETILTLLNEHISYLGKKGSQGYGQVNTWTVEAIEHNYSVWKDGEPMRPIPLIECNEYIEKNIDDDLIIQEHPVIPPYWREDYREMSVMPNEVWS